MTEVHLPIRVGVIGAGFIGPAHIESIRRLGYVEVAALAGSSQSSAEAKARELFVPRAYGDFYDLIRDSEIDVVDISSPNVYHYPAARAALEAGKHVMCEKPLGLNAAEVRAMLDAANAAGVVHMTAFTYRFAPAMRYLHHLVSSGALGMPRHFRSQRFLDWPETSWGWRQYKDKAGAGDLFDMTIHRIDFALDLMGPLASVCGAVHRFAPRDRTPDGRDCPPSDVDDWSCLIGEFELGAVGVWEGTTLAKGYGRNGFGHEWAEVNGSEGSAVYRLHEPNTILIGKTGSDLAPYPVPESFLKPAGSPRDPKQGEPATVFRYDLAWEFISAIVEQRQAVPSFVDGLNAQVVADAVLESYAGRVWVQIPHENPAT